MNRELAAAARRFADANSARLAAASSGPVVWATVVSLDPLKVSWRGGTVATAGYGSTYTPGVGHRVVCLYDDNNQLVVIDHIIGP